jgi:hypothetical protein
MKRLAILISLLLLLAGQTPVQQSGTVSPGHLPYWVTNGVIGDGGTAQNPKSTSIGTVGQGDTICANSGPITGPRNQLCLGVSTTSAAELALRNFGGALPQNLNFVVNGTTYTFPFNVGGIVGPASSLIGDLACWNNTVGTLTSDCGSTFKMPGSSTGVTTFTNGNNTSSNFTLTFPAASGNLAYQVGAVNNNDCLKASGTSGGIADCGTSFNLAGTSTGVTTIANSNTGASNFTVTLPSATTNLAYQVGNLTPGDCLQASGLSGGVSDSGIFCTSLIVPSNAALIASATTSFPNGVYRADFAAGNGASPLFYLPSASACSLNAGAGDNGSQVRSADAKCWLAQFGPAVSNKQFGAVCNGVADDATALQAWLTYIAANSLQGVGLAGTCIYKTALAVSSGNNWSIKGQGAHTTVFKYAGTNTSNDQITIGSGSADMTGVELSNFRVASTTVMTGGAGLHLERFNRSFINNLSLDGQDGNHALWHGIWFDRIDDVSFNNFELFCQADCMRVNGTVGAGAKADLFVSHGKISGGTVGLHVGGAFGGLYLSNTALIANGTNVVLDTALAAEGNREVFFGTGTAVDGSTTGNGIDVLDALALGGDLVFTGVWISSNHFVGLNITTNGFNVTYSGGVIYNNGTDGLKVTVSGTVAVTGTNFLNNGGFGVNYTVSTGTFSLIGGQYSNNASGDLSANAIASSTPIKMLPKFAGTNTTGAGSAALGANSPAVTNTAPYTWVKAISSDGSTVYIPAWK